MYVPELPSNPRCPSSEIEKGKKETRRGARTRNRTISYLLQGELRVVRDTDFASQALDVKRSAQSIGLGCERIPLRPTIVLSSLTVRSAYPLFALERKWRARMHPTGQ